MGIPTASLRHMSIPFFLQRVLCEFLSGLVHFLPLSHSSSSFECVSAIVSVLINELDHLCFSSLLCVDFMQ